MARRPIVPNRRVAILAGVVLFVLAVLFLYDAYDRHGVRPPWPIRVIMPM